MESPKKPNQPSWDKMLAASRSEAPPEIDVRNAVCSLLEKELSFANRAAVAEDAFTLFDAIIALFAQRTPKVGFAVGGFAAIAMMVFSVLSVSETELDDFSNSMDTNLEDSYIEVDWSDYL